jgi:hypothetical protein
MMSIVATVIAILQVVYICSREAIIWQKEHRQEREINEGQHQQEVQQQRSHRRKGIELDETTTPVTSESPQSQNFSMETQPPRIPMQPLLHTAQIHA